MWNRTEATDEIQGLLINRKDCSHDAACQKSSYGHTVLRYIKGIIRYFHMNNFQRGLLEFCETEQKPEMISKDHKSTDGIAAMMQNSSYGHTALFWSRILIWDGKSLSY